MLGGMNGEIPNPQILNVDQNVVQTLAMLLTRAQRGEIAGLLIATAEQNGSPGRYVAVGEKVGPITLFAMAGICVDMANTANGEANRKVFSVRPSPVLGPNGQAAMVRTGG